MGVACDEFLMWTQKKKATACCPEQVFATQSCGSKNCTQGIPGVPRSHPLMKDKSVNLTFSCTPEANPDSDGVVTLVLMS